MVNVCVVCLGVTTDGILKKKLNPSDQWVVNKESGSGMFVFGKRLI